VRGRWEAYLLQVVDNPEPGIDRALLIAGSDKRGTIFGIYELARRLGVSPWQWWADVPVPKRTSMHIAPGRFTDAPVVRYRGIFLNDEDPALGGWVRATYGGPNHGFYERVFDLILRLKGNYLWPAMWGRAFHDDDPLNPKLADEYGVVVGTTHHEPMLRAHVEWERYGKGPWDYARNPAVLREFWRRGIERAKDYESVVTLGMRGDGDEPMSQNTAIDLLERIVADQRRMLADVTGKPAQQIPQIWALYKEVQDYFDAGMDVPDDVTLLFSDDNWGNLRRLPKLGEKRGGGYGVYYHFDYVGGPRNYKWLNTTQIERVWEQLHLAHAYGADRLWIANVGDLKPMELPISFFLDYAWNPDAFPLDRLHAYPADWAAEQFGLQHAQTIGELLTRYTQYNARRKPELITPDTYSLIHFDEAQRVEAEWDALVDRTTATRAGLPAAWHDAYYQLVEYPVLASANLNKLYIAAARNRLYAQQGRATTNTQAAEVARLFARDAELARVYEQDIAGGKWIHMMSQPRFGYTGWQQPEKNIMPATVRRRVAAEAAMGIAVAGDIRAWPGAHGQPRLPLRHRFDANTGTFEVFNRGARPLRYTAKASKPWLRVYPASGEVAGQARLRVDVDWQRVPTGTHSGHVLVRGDEGSKVHIEVPILNPARPDALAGFVEADGQIAIEAQHYARAVAPQGLGWKVVPHLGRTLSGVIPWPVTAPAQNPGAVDGARLEYPFHLFQAGEFAVRVVLSPTLDFQHRGGLRFAVSIDDETPQIVTMNSDPTPGHTDFAAWERAVSDSVYVATSRHRVERAGAHTLKLWRVDSGTVFQRIELVRGADRASYLGPPESLKR
jgi:Glycosyl hydrolase family 115/Gylcosyl hydrolase family 115 C-terminal domain